MKKPYRIILLCAVIISGVLLFWRTSEKNVTETRQPPQETAVPQKETDDFEDENDPVSDKDLQLRKRLMEADAQIRRQLANIRKPTPEELHANDYGAAAKITLRVTDSRGSPVEGASVTGLLFPRSESEADFMKGVTDRNGLFSIEGKTRSFIEYVTEKEGYYPQKRGTYWVFRRDTKEPCFKDGRWVPWNPTIGVTLKEIRNPMPMYIKRTEMKIPEEDKPVGYDFSKGDWVIPYGKGGMSDMSMQYAETVVEEGKTLKRVLTIRFPNEKDGVLHYEKDMSSPMFSIYEAEDGNYQNEMAFVMEWKDWRLVEDTQLAKTGYLVFRTRTETDENGNIVSACYGKIDGPLEFGVGKAKYVRLEYYFNPAQNDRTLEPKSNLFEQAK